MSKVPKIDIEVTFPVKLQTRADAYALSIKPVGRYRYGVLIGDWFEDYTEKHADEEPSPQPEKNTDFKYIRDTSSSFDYRLNKIQMTVGTIANVMYGDPSRLGRNNYTTTNDLVYNHLPKPLCGPKKRRYSRNTTSFSCEVDLAKSCGNKTTWGLAKCKRAQWGSDRGTDFNETVYEVSYVPPHPSQYPVRAERHPRDSSFTKGLRFKPTKKKRS